MKFYTAAFFIIGALFFFEETSSFPTSDLRHKRSWSSDCKANKMLCCDDECPDVKYWDDDYKDSTIEDNVELNQSEDVSNEKDEASYGNDPANTMEVQDEEKLKKRKTNNKIFTTTTCCEFTKDGSSCTRFCTSFLPFISCC